MIRTRLFLAASVLLLLATGCGRSAEEQAVVDAYEAFVSKVETSDWAGAYDCFSTNTREFIDLLATGMYNWGASDTDDGRELFVNLMEESGEEITDISRSISSLTVTGQRATVVTATDEGDETNSFVMENGVWKLDWEDFLYVSVDEALQEIGFSVDELLPAYIETGEGEAFVEITNALGSWTIRYVYVDPSDAPWGDDRLGEELLYPGDVITIHVDPGTYDIQVEDEDGDTYTLWGVDLDAGGYYWEVTLGDIDGGWTDEGEGGGYYETGDGTAPVTIYNDLGSWTIWYVYVDPSDAPWGDDRLGSDLLYPGETITVWVDPGEYDLRVQDEDDDTYTLWNVSVGEAGYSWDVSLDDID
ncbi:hypothetical protein JW921_11040 [Candidatus Fermentibacterales bacterium]|nr:hypothetical protein [Candidatus Fermentibacterales bacterium]